jgi:hypothetical protein
MLDGVGHRRAIDRIRKGGLGWIGGSQGGGVKRRGAHVGRVGAPFRKLLEVRFSSTLDPREFLYFGAARS